MDISKQHNNALLACRNIDLSWRGKSFFSALQASFYTGDRVVIAAPSGRGKTTLLGVFAGTQTIDSGERFYRGQAFDDGGLQLLRQELFWLPQFPLMMGHTVAEHLLTPFALVGERQEKPTADKLQSVLQRLGLEITLDQPCRSLSGGQKQRLSVAQGYLLQRPVWMVDEPTSGQDDDSAEAIIRLIESQPWLQLLIVVSHDDRLQAYYSDYWTIQDCGFMAQPSKDM